MARSIEERTKNILRAYRHARSSGYNQLDAISAVAQGLGMAFGAVKARLKYHGALDTPSATDATSGSKELRIKDLLEPNGKCLDPRFEAVAAALVRH